MFFNSNNSNNLWNLTPFAILIVGLVGVLLFPTLPGSAGSGDDGEWAVNTSLLAATWYYILDAAHLPGANNTQWATNVEVCNFGNNNLNYELQFLRADQANLNPQSQSFFLRSMLCKRFNDVLLNVFGESNWKGTVRIEAQGSDVIRGTGRTFNQAPSGTFGAFTEGRFATDGVAFGGYGSIIGLSQSTNNNTGFRTNLSIQNVTPGNITVRIDLYDADGDFYGTIYRDLLAYEYGQLGTPFRQVTQGNVADGYMILSTPSAGGQFLANGSMVDNSTGDGVSVPLLRIAQ